MIHAKFHLAEDCGRGRIRYSRSHIRRVLEFIPLPTRDIGGEDSHSATYRALTPLS